MRCHDKVFKMCQISRKEFEKFTVNSLAPQPLFRGAMLMQTKKEICRIAHLKFLNNEYLLLLFKYEVETQD